MLLRFGIMSSGRRPCGDDSCDATRTTLTTAASTRRSSENAYRCSRNCRPSLGSSPLLPLSATAMACTICLANFQKFASQEVGHENPLFIFHFFHDGSAPEQRGVVATLGDGVVKMNMDTGVQCAHWEGIKNSMKPRGPLSGCGQARQAGLPGDRFCLCIRADGSGGRRDGGFLPVVSKMWRSPW